MNEINFIAVIIATIAQFIVGAIWYMPLFGNLWGKIHCFDQLDKKTQKAMQAQMGPYYLGQLVVTVLTTLVLAELMTMLPGTSPYLIALMAWFGFVVPTQFSSVIFGGTEGKWIIAKFSIMAGGALACVLVAATILSMM